MNWILAATRAISFGSALLVFGEIVFAIFVARPAWHAAGPAASAGEAVQRTVRTLVAWGVALGLLSGFLWLAEEVPLMSGQPFGEALTGPTIGLVLGRTRFGHVWLLRTVVAVVLVAWLAFPWRATRMRCVALVLAGLYVALPAFAGHAAGGLGAEGYLRIGADMLHLLAAGAWLGALPGLALLLVAAQRKDEAASFEAAAAATRRFSVLGITSVSVVVASGVVNSIYMIPSLPAFAETEYGRLLLLKLAFVTSMVGLAAVNRLRLAPRIGAGKTCAALARNALLEIAAGIAVIAIVGVLGITMPPMHAMRMEAMHRQLQSDTSRAMIPNPVPERPHG